MKKLIFSFLAAMVFLQVTNVTAAIWLTDLPKAQAKAKEENKLILLNFTGSDWCPFCMKLHKNVLTNRDFENYAKTNLVLVLVDFPKQKVLTKAQKAANEQLAERYQASKYPTVVVTDSDGKQLWKSVGYGGATAKDYLAEIEKLKKKNP